MLYTSINETKAMKYAHCYKLAVTKSFRKVAKPDKPQTKIKYINFLQLVYNGKCKGMCCPENCTKLDTSK